MKTTNRTEKSMINILCGFLNKTVCLFIPFFIRSLMLHTLGKEYLGVNYLFTAVLQVLNFAELGFGSAFVYSMYKPIAENDTGTLCALLNMYRKIYAIIGGIVFAGGCITLPFITYLIKDSYPSEINIYVIYFIFYSNTAIGYWLYTYKSSIFIANQRTDIISNISTITQFGLYIGEIVVLLTCHNFYVYVILLPIFTIINNLLIAWISIKKYPELSCKGTLPSEIKEEIFSKVKSLVGHKLGFGLVEAIDNLVVSIFLGLISVTMYNNYSYIINAVGGFLTIFYQAILAGIGNSMVTESKEKNMTDFKRLVFLNQWVIGWAAICFVCLFQPFMELWMGKSLMLSMLSVVLLTASFYVIKIRMIVVTYKDAAGLWNADKYKPYVVMFSNLLLDVVGVKLWGINGIIASTVFVRLFIGLPWETWALFKHYFNASARWYYIRLLINTVCFFALGSVTYYVCSFITSNTIPTFVVRAAICFVLPNVLFLALTIKNKNMQFYLQLIYKIIRRGK